MRVKLEGELHVEHEVEKHSECPHVDFEAVETLFVSREYFRGHKLLCTENGASYLSFLLAEPKIRQFKSFFAVLSFN